MDIMNNKSNNNNNNKYHIKSNLIKRNKKG